MIATIFIISLIVIAVINLVMEMKRDLMMLQQNSYRNERYRRWLSTSGDTTSMGTPSCTCCSDGDGHPSGPRFIQVCACNDSAVDKYIFPDECPLQEAACVD